MRAPASDNTLRVEHESLRERYRLAGKKHVAAGAWPAPSGRPGHEHRCAPLTRRRQTRLPLTLRARVQPCTVAILCCCRASNSSDDDDAWSPRERRVMTVRQWDQWVLVIDWVRAA